MVNVGDFGGGTLSLNGTNVIFNGGNFGNTGTLTLNGVISVSDTAAFIPSFATVNHNANTGITATSTSMVIPAETTYIMNFNSQLVDFGLVTNNGTLNINSNTIFENDITNNEILNWNGGNITSVANFNAINIGVFQIDVINESTGVIEKEGLNGFQTITTDFTNKAGGIVKVLTSKGLNLAGNSINNSGSFSINGLMSGEGSFVGNITNGNTGTLQPGSSLSGLGCFTFNNNTHTYTNQGTYKVEIDNLTPCSGYD